MEYEDGLRMVDVAQAEHVEITISDGGKELWVNVDGRCLFRSKAHKNLILDARGQLLLSEVGG